MPESSQTKLYRKNYYQQYRNRFKQVNIRLTPSEFTQIHKLARLNGLSLPKQMKRLAHAGFTSQRVLSPELQKQIDSLSAQIKAIANDVNHIASKYLFLESHDIDIRDKLGIFFEQLEALERIITQYFSHHDY